MYLMEDPKPGSFQQKQFFKKNKKTQKCCDRFLHAPLGVENLSKSYICGERSWKSGSFLAHSLPMLIHLLDVFVGLCGTLVPCVHVRFVCNF